MASFTSSSSFQLLLVLVLIVIVIILFLVVILVLVLVVIVFNVFKSISLSSLSSSSFFFLPSPRTSSTTFAIFLFISSFLSFSAASSTFSAWRPIIFVFHSIGNLSGQGANSYAFLIVMSVAEETYQVLSSKHLQLNQLCLHQY